ncbi:hypothetical protein J1N35_040889 [Gossypium stocksii]|uniref:CCHC-type domain-containing protein n=1 Tax=Gossypium stocksii TaxID=47602 RepID=A0A9D3ZIQ2_9ROSI|nr:hypothetical protein J1N35_040889 [Gossypium stocksii]
MAFDPVQAYPSVVMAWIRFPALPSYLYNCKIITEIGELVGKVVKLDLNIGSKTRGRFTRVTVYVNLDKPLVSHITEIGELVGKVVKLDLNIGSKTRGRFTRVTVYVNLDKPLVSQILINGRTQKVEYESLSTICFHCGRYGHVDTGCPFRATRPPIEKDNKSSKMIRRAHLRSGKNQRRETKITGLG